MTWLARRRFELVAVAIALVTAVVHLVTHDFDVVGGHRVPTLLRRAVQIAEGRLWDLKFRLRGPRAPHPKVAVIAIDERSSTAWGLWPWSRLHMARALERLADANVAAIGMDVTFVDARTEDVAEAQATLERVKALPPSPEAAAWSAALETRVATGQDATLEAAMKRLGPKLVQGVIPIDTESAKDYTPTQLDEFSQAFEPYVLRQTTSGTVKRQYVVEKSELFPFQALQAPHARFLGAGSSMGHFGAMIDIDGTIRRAGLLVRIRQGESFFPSMALMTAAVALGAQVKPVLKRAEVLGVELVGPDPRRIPFEEFTHFALIDYPGPAQSFASYSIYDVAEGKVGKAELEGKAVLIGVTIVGSAGDQRVTPFKELEPGVYTHAAMVSNILDGRFLTRSVSTLALELVLLILLALGLGVAIPRLRFTLKALLIAGVLGGWFAASYAAFLSGTQVFIAVPVVGLGTAAFTVVFLGYLSVDREKLKMKSTFSRYLGEDVIEIAMENPERLNKGEKRDMTVLFSDIRGFTTLSERMSPEALASFINEYLSPMTAIVFEEKGTLDKYIGDALMAFWNAPLDLPDHALRACRAAVKMLQTLDEMKKTWREKGYPELEIGIGVNTGPMVVGNMGSDVRVDYTVLGDAVNLGSRLEGTNKEYDTRIIISEYTWQHVKDEVVCRRLGAVRVKGKRLPVGIYELRGIGKPSASEAPVIALFEEALRLFTTRKFEEAGAKFREVLQAWPTDMSTRRYLAQIETFKAQPPPNDWDGVASLTTK
ncbi:MAG: adenylate/guanylate cyclase domain-containing protein [Myxococcaceae bacterium]|nr:adenylate/guanylate cyclase domain-containing protein [Myxococcaceae bacterium]